MAPRGGASGGGVGAPSAAARLAPSSAPRCQPQWPPFLLVPWRSPCQPTPAPNASPSEPRPRHRGDPPPLGDDALMATSPAPGALPFPRSRSQSRVSLASRFKLHSSRAELVASPSPPRGQAPAARLFVLVNCVTVPRLIPPPNSALAFAFFCKSSFNFHRRLLTSL